MTKLKLILRLRSLSNEKATWRELGSSGDGAYFAQIGLRECKEFVEECMALGAEQQAGRVAAIRASMERKAAQDDNLSSADSTDLPGTHGTGPVGQHMVEVLNKRIDQLTSQVNANETIIASNRRSLDVHGQRLIAMENTSDA